MPKEKYFGILNTKMKVDEIYGFRSEIYWKGMIVMWVRMCLYATQYLQGGSHGVAKHTKSGKQTNIKESDFSLHM